MDSWPARQHLQHRIGHRRLRRTARRESRVKLFVSLVTSAATKKIVASESESETKNIQQNSIVLLRAAKDGNVGSMQLDVAADVRRLKVG